jgi:hypothetical protein
MLYAFPLIQFGTFDLAGWHTCKALVSVGEVMGPNFSLDSGYPEAFVGSKVPLGKYEVLLIIDLL